MDILYFDLETSGPTEGSSLNPREGTIISVQVILPDGRQEFIDCRQSGVPERIRLLLEDPNILKVIHNAKFDLEFLKQQAGIEVKNIFCTLIAERLIQGGIIEPAKLGDLATKYVGTILNKEREPWGNLGPGPFPKDFKDYALKDVEVLPAIWKGQKARLSSDNLEEASKLEFDLVPIVRDMELKGIKLGPDRWTEALKEVWEEKLERAAELDSLFPFSTYQLGLFGGKTGSINWDSPKQVLEVLHKMGVNLNSTGKDHLKEYLWDHPSAKIIESLLGYRIYASLAKFDLPSSIDSKTGRIHAKFDQVGSKAGRFSCREPNLQQIPRDPTFRRCFIAEPGYSIVAADYSQIELRVLAEIADEPTMTRDFKNQRDLHLETAKRVFNDYTITREDGRRRIAKDINFAITYGAGAVTVAYHLQSEQDESSITKTQAEWFKEANKMLQTYYNTYPAIKDWKERNYQESVNRGYCLTISGRRRYFPEADSEGFFKRMASNTPIQGSAADIAKRALTRIGGRLRGTGAYIVSFIHDEILVEAPQDKARTISELVREEMIAAGQEFLHKVPVEVELKVADCWSK